MKKGDKKIMYDIIEIIKKLPQEIQKNISDYDDYMILYNGKYKHIKDKDISLYTFVVIGDSPDINTDEVYVSVGSIDKETALEYFRDMDEFLAKDYLTEHNLETPEEYFDNYTMHFISDIVSYYGMIEFEVGIGEVWHKVKYNNVIDFLQSYL